MIAWFVCNTVQSMQIREKGHPTVDDPSKPSHRLTNGPEPLKTIESDGNKIKTIEKPLMAMIRPPRTFNGDSLLKNH